MPVVIEGLDKLKADLKFFAPDLKKSLDKRARVALRAITNDVKSKVKGDIVGLSSWAKAKETPTSFPEWDEGTVKRGITFSSGKSKRNSEGFSAMYSVLNKSREGAIAEVAGRQHPHGRAKGKTHDSSRSNNPKAGEHFIEALNRGLGELENTRSDHATNKDLHTGRLIFAGVERNKGKAKDAILKAIKDTEASFLARRTRRGGYRKA